MNYLEITMYSILSQSSPDPCSAFKFTKNQTDYPIKEGLHLVNTRDKTPSKEAEAKVNAYISNLFDKCSLSSENDPDCKENVFYADELFKDNFFASAVNYLLKYRDTCSPILMAKAIYCLVSSKAAGRALLSPTDFEKMNEYVTDLFHHPQNLPPDLIEVALDYVVWSNNTSISDSALETVASYIHQESEDFSRSCISKAIIICPEIFSEKSIADVIEYVSENYEDFSDEFIERVDAQVKHIFNTYKLFSDHKIVIEAIEYMGQHLPDVVENLLDQAETIYEKNRSFFEISSDKKTLFGAFPAGLKQKSDRGDVTNYSDGLNKAIDFDPKKIVDTSSGDLGYREISLRSLWLENPVEVFEHNFIAAKYVVDNERHPAIKRWKNANDICYIFDNPKSFTDGYMTQAINYVTQNYSNNSELPIEQVDNYVTNLFQGNLEWQPKALLESAIDYTFSTNADIPADDITRHILKNNASFSVQAVTDAMNYLLSFPDFFEEELATIVIHLFTQDSSEFDDSFIEKAEQFIKNILNNPDQDNGEDLMKSAKNYATTQGWDQQFVLQM